MSPPDSGDVANTQLFLDPEVPRARVDRLTSDSIEIDRLQKISTAPTPEEQQSAMLDRVLSARPRDFSEAQHARVRSAIMGHVVKFPSRGGEYNQPPDKTITAQLLALAEWPRLCDFFLELRIDRAQAGERYGWFVVVALQRIHGVDPGAVKARRQELKLLRGLPKALAASKGFP